MPPTVQEQIAQELAAVGLRATRQRIAVVGALRRLKHHPTAIDLHRALEGERPNLSRKTVYEILSALVNAGLASCVTDGGEPFRYEANAKPHYHARCRTCGQLFDLPASMNSQIRGGTPLPEGFDVEHIHVTLHGRCYRCRDSS